MFPVAAFGPVRRCICRFKQYLCVHLQVSGRAKDIIFRVPKVRGIDGRKGISGEKSKAEENP